MFLCINNIIVLNNLIQYVTRLKQLNLLFLPRFEVIYAAKFKVIIWALLKLMSLSSAGSAHSAAIQVFCPRDPCGCDSSF